MANLTAEKLYTAYGPSEQFEAQMASASFFKGSLVGLDPVTGFYNKLEAGKPTLLAVGILRSTYNNTGDTKRNVADPGVYSLAGTFVVATDQGLPVYAIDDQTVSTSSNAGTRPFVGIIMQVDSTTRARVKIEPSPAAMAIFTGAGNDNLHAPVADATALQAIVATDRANGMVVNKLDDDTLWTFDSGSAAGASTTVIVPDAGTGRWLRKLASLAELALTTVGNGASLLGSNDAGNFTAQTTTEAQVQELYQHLFSAVGGYMPIPLSSFREVSATGDVGNIVAIGGVLASDTTPVFDAVATSNEHEILWATGNADPIGVSVALPRDFDDTADATLDLEVSSGATDAATIVCASAWSAGAAGTEVSDSTSDVATKSATAHRLSVTIAAADIPAGARRVTFRLTPPAHAADTISLHAAGLAYKRKLLTA